MSGPPPGAPARDVTQVVGRDARVVWGLGLGAVGLLLCGVDLSFDAPRAYAAYLTAYTAGLSVALGALILVMISHVTGAQWFVVLRRLAESVAATLPMFLVLFIPLVLGMRWLYPWVSPSPALDPHVAELIQRKAAYLNVPSFLLRAVVYFAVWIGLGTFLRRWSVRQDTEPSAEWTHRQRALSAGGLAPLALTLTFAAIDWLMSLSPAWYSSIFGAYYFGGAMVSALGLLAVLGLFIRRDAERHELVNRTHYHALGNLLLAFVMFWAYMGFSQLLIVWSADIPDEVSWYVPRVRGSWGVLGLVLVFGHFALPLFALLWQRIKRRPWVMAVLGVWLLVMHWLDLYWLVIPQVRPRGVQISWVDFAALLAVGGFVVAFGVWRQGAHPAIPVGDPALSRSLAYETVAPT